VLFSRFARGKEEYVVCWRDFLSDGFSFASEMSCKLAGMWTLDDSALKKKVGNVFVCAEKEARLMSKLMQSLQSLQRRN